MFSLFGKKKEGAFFGIDFGTRSLKAVELMQVKGRPTLKNYGWVDLDLDHDATALETYHGDHQTHLRNALQSLVQSLKPAAQTVNVAIPGFNGLVMMIDFPRMQEAEIDQAIQFEARKYIPASLDDVNISWEVAPDAPGAAKSDTIKVLLVAAPKGEVEHYNDLFSEVPLIVHTLELETFSLTRALIGNDPGTFILADIGAKTTNLVLVDNGTVFINRNIDVGGRDFTNTIADAMNISPERALSYKEGERNFLTSSGPAVVFPSLNFITEEIKRIIAAYDTNKPIDTIILAGGSAKMNGLTQYMTTVLGTKTIVGNPWSHIACDDAVRAHVESTLGSSFAVPIGLALKDFPT